MTGKTNASTGTVLAPLTNNVTPQLLDASAQAYNDKGERIQGIARTSKFHEYGIFSGRNLGPHPRLRLLDESGAISSASSKYLAWGELNFYHSFSKVNIFVASFCESTTLESLTRRILMASNHLYDDGYGSAQYYCGGAAVFGNKTNESLVSLTSEVPDWKSGIISPIVTPSYSSYPVEYSITEEF